jgi:hypothetical protein
VDSESTLTDGKRTIKLYTMTGFEHTVDMLMVYLPNEKILAEADAYTPPATPTTPLIAPKTPYAAALYDNIEQLKLDVRQSCHSTTRERSTCSRWLSRAAEQPRPLINSLLGNFGIGLDGFCLKVKRSN